MNSKTVKFSLDLQHLPPLTEAQKAELAAVASMPDEQIDYSDLPPLNESFLKNAFRNPFRKQPKTTTIVSVDADVLRWLRSQGKGYRMRINAILRAAMLKDLHKS
jgi:uncharacterized protein (DUF4415 family)